MAFRNLPPAVDNHLPAVYARILYMTTLSLAEARANLSKLVESAVTTHERFEVTRNGDRVAVLLGADDYDSLLETLDILSNPDEVAAIRDGLAELEANEVFTADEVRAALTAREMLAGCPAPTRSSSPDRPAVPSSANSPRRSQPQPSSSSWDRSAKIPTESASRYASRSPHCSPPVAASTASSTGSSTSAWSLRSSRSFIAATPTTPKPLRVPEDLQILRSRLSEYSRSGGLRN